MRIALLSTIDVQATTSPERVAPPFVQFAGATVVERQLDLALAAGCTAVACLADSIGRCVLALQHRAERAGARFVILRDPRGLSGLVTAADEILVIAPAVLPDPEAVLRLTAQPAVLVFPADPAVAQGYERIDAETAWSGVLLARGSAVERLSDLPSDIDVPSALLRTVLQARARIVLLDEVLLDEGAWHVRATPEQLAQREARFVRRNAAPAPYSAPGRAVAERMGARLARDVLDKGGERLPWIAAAVAALVAAGLAFAGRPEIGLGAAAVMAAFLAMGRVVERVRATGEVRPEHRLLAQIANGLLDPLVIVLVALASPDGGQRMRLFAPLVLTGLLHLGERFGSARWRPTYGDRIVLTLLLLPAALFGVAHVAVAVLTLIVLVALFFDLRPAAD